MSFFATQAPAWDSALWEFSLVFEDLEDADLWRRPHPSLLSVGENAAHVVYWAVSRATAVNPSARIESPLAREEARYYLTSVDTPLVLEMTVAEVEAELARVGKEAKEAFLGVAAPREAPAGEGMPGDSLGQVADYMVFHIAYHAGQAFSARHLMGHKTNDN
jgi:hypothetical protein